MDCDVDVDMLDDLGRLAIELGRLWSRQRQGVPRTVARQEASRRPQENATYDQLARINDVAYIVETINDDGSAGETHDIRAISLDDASSQAVAIAQEWGIEGRCGSVRWYLYDAAGVQRESGEWAADATA